MVLCSQWATGAEVLLRPGCDGIDLAVANQAAADASDLVYRLSGRQFPGACSDVLRPRSRPNNESPSSYYRWLGGFGWTGSWYNVAGSWGICLGGDHDGCQQSRVLDLLRYPVRSVTAVKVDGATLPASAYHIDDDRLLIRDDGNTWPHSQDIHLADTEVGTFSVAFSWGADPPGDGISAAITLAAELAKARSNLTNRLPSRLQSINRQGVSMTVLDPQNFLNNGKTGIYEVDLFLISVNPQRAQAPTVVYSPDLQQQRRSRTTYP